MSNNEGKFEGTGMSKERWEFLERNIASHITQDDIDNGWHFCEDWDCMLIHKSWPEMESCTCEFGRKDKKDSG